jgi:hypothetical protein
MRLTLNAKIFAGGIASLAMVTIAAAQTAYHDPAGRFQVQVPAGWQVIPDKEADQVVFRDGAVQAIVSVQLQEKNSPVTAKLLVEATGNQFKAQCPTTQSRKTGTVSLTGGTGVYEIFTCSDAQSPAVAEADALLTPNMFLVGFTSIAPLARYYASLPVLDGIRDSLTLPGQKANPPDADEAVDEVKKACAVGVFAQGECARQIGIAMTKEDAAGASGSESGEADPLAGSSLYRDAGGRFSVKVPKGWKATAEGDDGANGVQLRNGSNWINVMPAEGATSASDVVLGQERLIAQQSKSDRKPPFGGGQLMQLFGHGLEVTCDSFKGVSAQGNPVESWIAGIGDISGKGHSYLLMAASLDTATGKDPSQGGVPVIAVAQSIQMPAR